MTRSCLRNFARFVSCAIFALAVPLSASADRSIDTVSVGALNTPTLDCYRSFDEYDLKSAQVLYVNVQISCAGTLAYISYESRHQYQ